jgi:hypothetical protein
MTRQTDFAESMMNSATSSAADPVNQYVPASRRRFLQSARTAMGIVQIA